MKEHIIYTEDGIAFTKGSRRVQRTEHLLRKYADQGYSVKAYSKEIAQLPLFQIADDLVGEWDNIESGLIFHETSNGKSFVGYKAPARVREIKINNRIFQVPASSHLLFFEARRSTERPLYFSNVSRKRFWGSPFTNVFTNNTFSNTFVGESTHIKTLTQELTHINRICMGEYDTLHTDNPLKAAQWLINHPHYMTENDNWDLEWDHAYFEAHMLDSNHPADDFVRNAYTSKNSAYYYRAFWQCLAVAYKMYNGDDIDTFFDEFIQGQPNGAIRIRDLVKYVDDYADKQGFDKDAIWTLDFASTPA